MPKFYSDEPINDDHHVWDAIDDLREDVGLIKTDQATLLATMKQVGETVNSLNRLNQSSKTPWAVIWTAIGVVILFLSALSGAVLAPLYMANAHVSNAVEREREDRIIHDNSNEDSSIARHIAADATALQQHESVTTLIAQDKAETRLQLARLEGYFDTIIRAHMRKLVTESKIDDLTSSVELIKNK